MEQLGTESAEILGKSSTTCVKYAILLPVTSKGSNNDEDFWSRMDRFCFCLAASVAADPWRVGMHVFLGLDDDDQILGVQCTASRERITQLLVTGSGIVDSQKLHIISLSRFQPGAICKYWCFLAKKAYNCGCTHFVLLGDDVEIKSPFWMRDIDVAFRQLSAKNNTPVGFGCVSFTDESFLAFPTFPVVTRVHMDIFDGALLPDLFVNQDGDPFLFQLYRRWGCSVKLRKVRLCNTIGGSDDARYVKERASHWTGHTLDTAVSTVSHWLSSKNARCERRIVLDVIIPTFRCKLDMLLPVLKLQAPPNCEIGFIVIIDQESSDIQAQLEDIFADDVRYRIRCQGANTGASMARNRGLTESAADWVLFLDDDVVPSENLLKHYVDAIVQHPEAKGFAGPSLLPTDTPESHSMWCQGPQLAGVTFFWALPRTVFWKPRLVPWAVTANVLFRRNPMIRFDAAFPRTGGGEDIDYAMQVTDGRLIPVPDAEVTHPWWNNGRPPLSRFYGWAFGDGYLIRKHPQWRYVGIPNLCETLLLGYSLAIAAKVQPFIWTNCHSNTFETLLEPRRMGLVTLGLMLGDIGHEIWHHCVFRRQECPHITGLPRFSASIWACVVRNASELGRLCGHLSRGHVGLVGFRFEWFLGLHKDAYFDEMQMGATRVLWWTLCASMLLKSFN